ncbi:uncharacterized protein V1518DRAFT_423980 [Limtongia smithiae]|uniref:uncharacterized protein n=1 Tax=Limtongia smithiae TaxID=1125753 RepID=UPI0034CD177B
MSRQRQVLNSYRSLLRATRIAFGADTRMLLAARGEIRRNYDLGAREFVDDGTTAAAEELNKRLEHAAGVALILRSNIAQGVMTPDGERATSAPSTTATLGGEEDGVQDEGTYQIRLHKYSELGDNKSVKGGKTNLGGRSRSINWNQQ